MRVAYVIPSLQKPGGWRSHACAFISAIRQHVEPVLFVAAADLEAARLLFPGQKIFSLPVTQQASFATRSGLRGLAACFRTISQAAYPVVDLVHSLEAYPTGLAGAWLANRLGRPHVLTTHGTYGVIWYERKLDRVAYEYTLRKTRLICPVSHGTARLMQRYFTKALSGACIHPILNGNDYHKTISRQEALSRPAPDRPTLLTVGDVKPRKGQHASLAAFAIVKDQLPEARYWIAGRFKPEQAYMQQIQQQVAAQKIQEVTFLGDVSEAELRRCYREASLFVLTPQPEGLHFEGFGLVYLEAGAYGLPVVGTRSGGIPDAVKDGETGFLAEPGDIDGIAEAILRLLTDGDLARRMGRANRQWAETLTWERTAQEQYQAYQALLAGDDSRPHPLP